MNDFSDSVMMALLPTTSDWCKQPLPHMTLVYAGDKNDLSIGTKNEMAKAAMHLAMVNHLLTVPVIGVDSFGDNKDEEVLTLEATPQLLAMRSIVQRWNASQWPFSPHVTCGPIGSVGGNIPSSISFDQIALVWGTEMMAFKMI